MRLRFLAFLIAFAALGMLAYSVGSIGSAMARQHNATVQAQASQVED